MQLRCLDLTAYPQWPCVGVELILGLGEGDLSAVEQHFRTLIVTCCASMQRLTNASDKQDAHGQRASFTALPQGLCAFTSLQVLRLQCENLAHLPSALGSLTNLRQLDLDRCYSLADMPGSISSLSALTMLRLMACAQLSSLPSQLTSLSCLKHLYLELCSGLTSLVPSISNLSALERLDLRSCGLPPS